MEVWPNTKHVPWILDQCKDCNCTCDSNHRLCLASHSVEEGSNGQGYQEGRPLGEHLEHKQVILCILFQQYSNLANIFKNSCLISSQIRIYFWDLTSSIYRFPEIIFVSSVNFSRCLPHHTWHIRSGETFKLWQLLWHLLTHNIQSWDKSQSH